MVPQWQSVDSDEVERGMKGKSYTKDKVLMRGATNSEKLAGHRSPSSEFEELPLPVRFLDFAEPARGRKTGTTWE